MSSGVDLRRAGTDVCDSEASTSGGSARSRRRRRTARFTDVPTNAQFFREVEALAESGITLGCTATTFCPDAPLTRRQMAAFLARALGLYWQY